MLFRANGTDRLLGEAFFLEWQTQANSCTPSGGAPNDGWTPANIPSDLTSWTFAPDVSTLGTYTYTLSCTSGALTISKNVVVTIENDRVPYVEASIDTTSIPFAIDPPNYFTLTWKSNLSQCQPSSEPNIGQYQSTYYPEDTGLVVPHLPGSFALKVICFKFNSNETVESAPFNVTVSPPPPPTASISISPTQS